MSRVGDFFEKPIQLDHAFAAGIDSYLKPSNYDRAKHYPAVQKPLQIVITIVDFLLVLICGLVTCFVTRETNVTPSQPIEVYSGVSLVAAAVFVLGGHFQSMYIAQNLLNIRWQLRKVAATWAGSLLILMTVAFLLQSTALPSSRTVLVFAAAGLMVLWSHRAIWRYGLTDALAKGQLRDRRVVLLSLRPLDFTSGRLLDLRRHGFEVVRHFVLPGGGEDISQRNELMQNIIGEMREMDVDEYLLALDWHELGSLRDIAPRLRVVPQPVRLLPDIYLADLASKPYFPVGDTIALELQRSPLDWVERAQKRLLDVALASIALLILSPLMIIVACLIKLDSPGSFLFLQSRRGFNGKTFDIYKFRSMTVAENGHAVTQATKNDPRVTRIGRVIRKTSIDELPQLWNVLRGEMSLVGPRPHAIAHDRYYDEMIDLYAFRHHVKPGLTGWAQIHGFRGETPSIDLMEKRIEHDVWYVNNWSIWIDMWIICRTAIAVFKQDAY